jgi:hypothetical protein
MFGGTEEKSRKAACREEAKIRALLVLELTPPREI